MPVKTVGSAAIAVVVSAAMWGPGISGAAPLTSSVDTPGATVSTSAGVWGSVDVVDWLMRNRNTSGPATATKPWISGSPLACDADGDGRDSPGSYDHATGTFLLSDAPYPLVRFGPAGGLAGNRNPVCGDWDGDGRDGIGLARYTSSGAWRWVLRDSPSPGRPTYRFRFAPIPEGVEYYHLAGDWNGDGIDTPGFFQRGTRGGTWTLTNHNRTDARDRTFRFGSADKYPVTGDWDGDGRDTVGTFDDGSWRLADRNRRKASAQSVDFGRSGIYPAPGDWDGDGDTTVGVVRLPR